MSGNQRFSVARGVSNYNLYDIAFYKRQIISSDSELDGSY